MSARFGIFFLYSYAVFDLIFDPYVPPTRATPHYSVMSQCRWPSLPLFMDALVVVHWWRPCGVPWDALPEQSWY